MGVWSAYRALNAEQRRVLRSKSVVANRPIEALIEFLRPIAAFDALSDKARTRFGCSAALGVLLLIVAAVLAGNGVLPTFAAWLVFLVLIATTLALIYAYIWTRRVDVTNNFRSFVLPVLNLLRDDAHPKEPVSVKIDLRPTTVKEKLQRKQEPYAAGAYYKIVESFYVNAWMSAAFPLADGNVLSWSVTDYVRELKKTKRNARGKIKTKTKYKTRSEMEVELTLRNDAYALETTGSDNLRESGKRKKIRMKGTHKSDTLGLENPTPLIDMVAGIYRRATPQRKESS